jgi:hypothetical protein
VKVENIICDYQSIPEVLGHIVGEHVLEAYGTVRGVYQVFVILGGDHVIGAFCLPLNCREKERKHITNHLDFIQS